MLSESCHACWVSHVTHVEWVMSRRRTRRDTYECHSCWMSHVTHMNESCHSCWMSYVTHMNDTYECHTLHMNVKSAPSVCSSCNEPTFASCESAVSHLNDTHWMRHVKQANEASHIWMRHVTNWTIHMSRDLFAFSKREPIAIWRMGWLRFVGSSKW